MKRKGKEEAQGDPMGKAEACLALAPLAELVCAVLLLRLDRDGERGGGGAGRALGVDVEFGSGAAGIFWWEGKGEDKSGMRRRSMGAYLARWRLSMEGGAPEQNKAFAQVAWRAVDAMDRLGAGRFVAAKAACAAFEPRVAAWERTETCLGAQACVSWMALGWCPIEASAILLMAPARGQDAGVRAAMEAAVLREVAVRTEAPSSPHAMRL